MHDSDVPNLWVKLSAKCINEMFHINVVNKLRM